VILAEFFRNMHGIVSRFGIGFGLRGHLHYVRQLTSVGTTTLLQKTQL
jgi:hypothetical protein